MSRLFDIYRTVHEQGFVPIFVQDDFNTRTLVEACVAAGVKAIEYTLRRPDAREMIPWIKKTYPDLYLLAGSTLDDEKIVQAMRPKNPQLLTLQELADLGVDGFVSMLGWTFRSIERYASTHLVIPSAYTATEALLQVGAGAHLIKFSGNNLDLVRTCRMPPTFDYCPIFVTGGITTERIPKAVQAGAAVVASGFDIILKGCQTNISVRKAAEAVRTYLDAAEQARTKVWPEMISTAGTSKNSWLDALPHYHPF